MSMPRAIADLSAADDQEAVTIIRAGGTAPRKCRGPTMGP
jgi:hypothetical protein